MTLVTLLVGLMAVLTLLAPFLAERLLYHPGVGVPGPPPPAGAVRGEELRLTASDGVSIHGWWYAVPDAPVILLLHGNAGHIGGRGFIAHELVRRGWSVLLLEYRGYGRSEGRPSEAGLRLDGAAGYAFARERAGGAARVVLFGRSLGAAVAAGLSREEVPGALILDSPFTSLEEMAAAVYPFLPRFVFRRLRGRWDTRAALADVAAPLLVIHAEEDELVPVRMGRELFDRAGEPRAWFPVAGAGHNDLIDVAGAAYFERIDRFLRMHLR
jgi:uncharacterized protein